jgi:hypothetical protein
MPVEELVQRLAAQLRELNDIVQRTLGVLSDVQLRVARLEEEVRDGSQKRER